MLQMQLYHSLPSDTWAVASHHPMHENIRMFVGGFASKAVATQAAMLIAQKLEMEPKFVS